MFLFFIRSARRVCNSILFARFSSLRSISYDRPIRCARQTLSELSRNKISSYVDSVGRGILDIDVTNCDPSVDASEVCSSVVSRISAHVKARAGAWVFVNEEILPEPNHKKVGSIVYKVVLGCGVLRFANMIKCIFKAIDQPIQRAEIIADLKQNLQRSLDREMRTTKYAHVDLDP